MRTRTFPPIFLRWKGARHEQEFCPCGPRYQGPMAEPHGRPVSRIAERPPSILFSPSPAVSSRGRGCKLPFKERIIRQSAWRNPRLREKDEGEGLRIRPVTLRRPPSLSCLALLFQS